MYVVSEAAGQSFDPSEFPVLGTRIPSESSVFSTGGPLPSRPGYGEYDGSIVTCM